MAAETDTKTAQPAKRVRPKPVAVPDTKRCRGYRAEVELNRQQVEIANQHSANKRSLWNWMVDTYEKKMTEEGVFLDQFTMSRLLTQVKKLPKEQGGLPWLDETPRDVLTQVLLDFFKSIRRYWKAKKFGTRCRPKPGKKKPRHPIYLLEGVRVGFPRFRRRFDGFQGLTFDRAFSVSRNRIKLPILGRVKLKQAGYVPVGTPQFGNHETGYLPGATYLKRATLTQEAGRFFVSVMVIEDLPPPGTGTEILGIDMGVGKNLAIVSNGTNVPNPRVYRRLENRIQKLQRRLSRKDECAKKYGYERWTNRRAKLKEKIARLHQRISNVRRDAAHKSSTALVDSAQTVVIEDLNIAGMAKNHHIAKSIADAGMGTFVRMLEYKAAAKKVPVIKADRFFPSSKTCSGCGWVNKNLKLGDRTFVCQHCGLRIDRDENASINLRNLALNSDKESAGGQPVEPDGTSELSMPNGTVTDRALSGVLRKGNTDARVAEAENPQGNSTAPRSMITGPAPTKCSCMPECNKMPKNNRSKLIAATRTKREERRTVRREVCLNEAAQPTESTDDSVAGVQEPLVGAG